MTARKIILASIAALGALGIAVVTIALAGANPACASTEELQVTYAEEWQAFERASNANPELASISDVNSRLETWCELRPAEGTGLCARFEAAEDGGCMDSCTTTSNCTWDLDSCDECAILFDMCAKNRHVM